MIAPQVSSTQTIICVDNSQTVHVHHVACTCTLAKNAKYMTTIHLTVLAAPTVWSLLPFQRSASQWTSRTLLTTASTLHWRTSPPSSVQDNTAIIDVHLNMCKCLMYALYHTNPPHLVSWLATCVAVISVYM